MVLSGYGFSDSGVIRGIGLPREGWDDPSDLPAMLKLGRWAVLGLVILGTVHFLIAAFQELYGEALHSEPYTKDLAVLAAQEREVRAIEPRVTGGFLYAPYQPGGKSSENPASFRAVGADSGSPGALGARAIALLLQHGPDRANALLQQALAVDAHDPRLFSDLAAGLLVRAELKASPYDLVQALAAADRALDLTPSFPEARFNQALALTRLALAPEAEKAWQAYLGLDQESGWSEEARAHLQRLREPREAERWPGDRDRLDQAALAGRSAEVRRIVDAYRQPARLYVEDKLLGDWATARAAEKTEESTHFLIIARAVAEALDAGMLQEEVAAAEEAVREDGGRLIALVQGHILYAKARELHEQQKYPEAEPLFRQAAAELENGRSPFSAWAELYLAIISHHHAQQPKAILELERLRERFEGKDYAPLLGTIDWMIGQARGIQGPIASALPSSESALRQFQRAGEIENQAAMDSTLARIYTELGDSQQAWLHHRAALQALPRLYKPRRVQNILSVALQSLRATGDLGPAAYFQAVLVEEAYRANIPTGITVALRNQAALLDKLGRRSEAIASLSRARSVADQIKDSFLRQGVEIGILVTEGRILRVDHPKKALQALNRALAVSLQDGNRHLLIQILQERAETWLVLGREREAEADLEAGLAELERQRRILEDSTLRIFFADQARALLEERIALQLQRGERAEITLDTAEQLRARALLDTIGNSGPDGWPESVPAHEIAAALPPGIAIVEYLWVRDDLLAWVITRSGVEVVMLGTGRERVERMIDRFLSNMSDGGEVGPDSRRLHRRLIAPLEHRLTDASTLIIVPDGKLCRVPFAALQNERGRFLVEDFPLAAAPSASVYLALAERYRERSTTAPVSILLVGEPWVDRSLFPTLPSLPASAQEIKALERLYERSIVLTGEAATAERFLTALPGEDVLHFAGHTVTPSGAEAPRLLLTRSAATGDSGLLPPEAIHRLRRPLARLAVLAGCSTAEGRLSQNEGTLGLARAFLATGIPTVVASLWEAEDAPSAQFFLRFHRMLRAGADPLTALRQTQLDFLRSPDRAIASPHTWAAFHVLGGAFPLPENGVSH